MTISNVTNVTNVAIIFAATNCGNVLISISIHAIAYVTNHPNVTTNAFAIILINILFADVIIIDANTTFISINTTTTIRTITPSITNAVIFLFC